ncbi:MAG: hypothetical protein ACR2GX_06860 [Candidatus Dormibacteria bacterium]
MSGLLRASSLGAESGQLFAVGTPKLLGGVRPAAIIVIGEEGHRCSILTAAGSEDLHRKLCQGATNLVSAAPKTGRVPFTASAVLDDLSRHLPRGYRIAKPRPVDLRDVHGTGRILFDAEVGGAALDDDFELRRGVAAPAMRQSSPSPG